MARAGSLGPGHTVGSGMFRRSRDNMNKGERFMSLRKIAAAIQWLLLAKREIDQNKV